MHRVAIASSEPDSTRPREPVAARAAASAAILKSDIPEVCDDTPALEFTNGSTGFEDDCDALLAARDQLRGTVSLNWDTATVMTQWEGVMLGTSGVERLYLHFRGLDGSIPPELGALGDLEVLSLGRNELTGEIPPELGSMRSLERLYLQDNELTGEIPPELGSLNRLERLYMWRNQLSGEIPPQLGSLSGMRRLSMGGNGFGGEIPSELGRLSQLELLSLWGNELTGSIPNELGGLSRIERLSLSQNQLTGGIPLELGRLRYIEYLYLYENDLTGSIPEPAEGAWEQLRLLWLYDNRLTGGIPAELQNTDLRSLSVSLNAGLTGRLPEDLQALLLSWFQWHGTGLCSPADPSFQAWLASIDEEGGGPVCPHYQRGDTIWTLPTGLWTPDAVSDASFQSSGGQVTITFRDGGYIEEADTRYTCTASGGCRIVGRVVAQGTIEVVDVGDRDALVALYEATDGPNWLDNTNWLTDASLGDWYGVSTDGSGRVVQLRLPGNELTGEIPTELGHLDRLEELHLISNNLTGVIPTELGQLDGLRVLDLGANSLTGVIPVELGQLDGLRVLNLGTNSLTGVIPVELGQLDSLRQLYLDTNELTGQIPAELGNLTSLEWFVLHDNDLTGVIPGEFGQLDRLRHLWLAGNDLTGAIPTELGQLDSLQVLWLSGNDLTGAIPAELGQLDKLYYLGLRSNDLTGRIPAELGQLARLELLYVYSNRLTGEIPADFLQLGSLIWFRFHDNDGLCAPTTNAFTSWLGGIANWSGPRCGGNQSPVTQGTISAQTVKVGESVSVNASSYFSDPDGDALTYAASSSRTNVATASVSGRTVTVAGVAEGTATIRVTATDPGGLSATQSFSVTVEAEGDDFETFSGLRITNEGAVTLRVGGIFLSAGRTGCISGGGTLNGKLYDYHWTAWQRNTGSGWNEVSGSRQTGKLCGYNLTSAPSGKYRLVGDMTLAGTRGKYKSENEVSK